MGSSIEVPNLKPFCDNIGHLAVIMDLDGVLCESGNKDTTHTNIEKLVSLRRIAKQSDIITFDSSRFRVNKKSHQHDRSVINFPFFNLDSGDFLRDIIKRSNPDCRVNFKVDFMRKEKKVGVDEREQLVREYLKQGRKVVFIGSSRNDIRVAKTIIDNIDEPLTDRVFVYNTNHWII